eukprot:8535788-Alexandrium_andersonii.AAC.1
MCIRDRREVAADAALQRGLHREAAHLEEDARARDAQEHVTKLLLGQHEIAVNAGLEGQGQARNAQRHVIKLPLGQRGVAVDA